MKSRLPAPAAGLAKLSGPAPQVWVAQVPDQLCPAELEELLSPLPPSLAARIMRFQHPHDRLLRLGGLRLMAHGLHQVAGLDLAESYAALHYAPLGRPQLTSAAQPNPWQLSFSYAFPFVACALHCGQQNSSPPIPTAPHSEGLGIDIEIASSASSLYTSPTSCFAQVFTPAEQQAIADSADSGKARVLRWTIKEAIVKAVGTGFGLTLATIDTCVPAISTSPILSTGPRTHSSAQHPVYALHHANQWIFWQSSAVGDICLTIAAHSAWRELQISFLRLAQKGHTLLLL